MILFLLSCFPGPNPYDEDGLPGPAPSEEAHDGSPPVDVPSSLPSAPDGWTNLCVDPAPGQTVPPMTWVYLAGGINLLQVELKTPWERSRCGLVQTMYIHSGLKLRSDAGIPVGVVAGMTYWFEDGTSHGAENVVWEPSANGWFYTITFDPLPATQPF